MPRGVDQVDGVVVAAGAGVQFLLFVMQLSRC